MSTFTTCLAAGLLTAATTLSTASAADTVYTVTPVTTLGGTQTYPTAMNPAGDIVGYNWLGTRKHYHAFLNHKGKAQQIDKPFGWTGSQAQAINAAGHVAGFHDGANFTSAAFLLADGIATDLGISPFGDVAWAVNDADQVAGEYLDADLRRHAFVWQAGETQDLGTLGGLRSGALAINQAGHVVGYAAMADNMSMHAFLYRDGTMLDLGLPRGTSSSFAVAINDADQVAGYAYGKQGGSRCFILKGQPGDSLMDLGDLGGSDCQPSGINRHATVVGTAKLASQAWHGFVWSRGTMRDLNTMLDPVTGAGWYISDAVTVNDQGQILALAVNVAYPGAAALLTPVKP